MMVESPCFSYGEYVNVKDYSENKGMYDWLKEKEVVKRQVGVFPSGYVVMPVVEIDKEKLLSLSDEKTKTTLKPKKKKGAKSSEKTDDKGDNSL